MEILDDLITARQAAAIIGIHRNNVMEAVKGGRLKGRKIAGRYLVLRSDAEAYKMRRAAKARRAEEGKE